MGSMRAENFDVNDIIDHKQGTASSFSFDDCFGEYGICNDDFTPKYPDMTEDDLTDDDYDAIDNSMFNCTGCGWWCESHQARESSNGEQICDDCKDEEGEQEDEE